MERGQKMETQSKTKQNKKDLITLYYSMRNQEQKSLCSVWATP